MVKYRDLQCMSWGNYSSCEGPTGSLNKLANTSPDKSAKGLSSSQTYIAYHDFSNLVRGLVHPLGPMMTNDDDERLYAACKVKEQRKWAERRISFFVLIFSHLII